MLPDVKFMFHILPFTFFLFLSPISDQICWYTNSMDKGHYRSTHLGFVLKGVKITTTLVVYKTCTTVLPLVDLVL